MRSGKLLWRVTGTVAFLSLLLFLTGFSLSLQPQALAPDRPGVPDQTAPAEQAPLPKTGQLNVVALGDSLTRGVGDADGEGYVGKFRAAYEKASGQPITLTNLAISGIQSGRLKEQLQETTVQKLVQQADLILFTIGGNDLFQQSGGIADLDKEMLDRAAVSLAHNFTQILTTLRTINPEAKIVHVSLYNPFGDTEAKADTTPPTLAWNSTAADIAARFPNVVVVPTYDLFYQKEKMYLYNDHFHPNSDGYERMAMRVMQAVE
ncbi:GDSL-type esterase/lipase family protein [Brevibacillus dissolubilis]|uniref:GDSL-type esterase/lipase family protein n=1 Tax=Brevibacillus dissolubilis TaxID=1844116 RepID=UPI00111683DD|nr:GDSL-type esterase/lipase family protein [Brevibacillus dissolubilis]